MEAKKYIKCRNCNPMNKWKLMKNVKVYKSEWGKQAERLKKATFPCEVGVR